MLTSRLASWFRNEWVVNIIVVGSFLGLYAAIFAVVINLDGCRMDIECSYGTCTEGYCACDVDYFPATRCNKGWYICWLVLGVLLMVASLLACCIVLYTKWRGK